MQDSMTRMGRKRAAAESEGSPKPAGYQVCGGPWGKAKKKNRKENTSDHLEGRSSTCDMCKERKKQRATGARWRREKKVPGGQLLVAGAKGHPGRSPRSVYSTTAEATGRAKRATGCASGLL